MDFCSVSARLMFLVAFSAICSNLKAADSPGLSKENMAELQRLEKDPNVQDAVAKWTLATQQVNQQHLRALAANGDARSLLGAAMLWSGNSVMTSDSMVYPRVPAQETRVWFDAARRARPRDALVAWIEATDCGNLTDSCNPREALQFLLDAEPDNAAVQLLAFGEAEKRGDKTAMDAHWQAAAAASVYDAYMRDIRRLLHDSMRGVDYPPFDSTVADALGLSMGLNRPATPQDFTDVGIIALTVALAMPQFTPVMQHCALKSLATASPARRSECQQVLALLAKDESTLVTQSLALPRLVLLAGDTEEGRAWREKLRQFYWVYENGVMQLSGLTPGGPLPADYAAWFMTEGEVAAMRKLIAGHGLPAEAPAGWLPTQPRQRALISTGKEPVVSE